MANSPDWIAVRRVKLAGSEPLDVCIGRPEYDERTRRWKVQMMYSKGTEVTFEHATGADAVQALCQALCFIEHDLGELGALFPKVVTLDPALFDIPDLYRKIDELIIRASEEAIRRFDQETQ